MFLKKKDKKNPVYCYFIFSYLLNGYQVKIIFCRLFGWFCECFIVTFRNAWFCKYFETFFDQ